MIDTADQNQMASDLSPIDPVLLAWAEYWYPIAWKGLLAAGVLTAFAACAGMAFLLLQWRTSAVLEQHVSWRTSALEVQVKKADAEIATAKQQTAEANERTAQLAKEAAEARLEQERLKAQLAWRTIAPDVSAVLELTLREHPGKINLQWANGDTEAQFLAIQLANIFDRAHWEKRTAALNRFSGIAFGLRVFDLPGSPSPDDLANVRAAFTAVQIPFAGEMPPMPGGTTAFGNVMNDAPIIFVGTKPATGVRWPLADSTK
jgi:hypothetical protein